jgi:hypothetical protein
MAGGSPGAPGRPPPSITLDSFTVCAALGVILIAAGALLAFDELESGGDYSIWYALIDLVPTAAVGVLVLVCARRLGPALWGDSLMRAVPILGIAAGVAAAGLALEDATGEFADHLWDPLLDLVFYIPVALCLLLYLSGVTRGDRVLGQPSYWGRLVGVIGIAVSLAVAVNDASDASRNEFWVFLATLAPAAGICLLLISACLEPPGAPRPAAQPNSLALINDPRMANWVALGGFAVIVSAVMLSFKAMDESEDGFWTLLQVLAIQLGLGLTIFIAAGVRLGPNLDPRHPYVRWAAIGCIAGAFVSGLKFTADADSEQFWLFWDYSVVPAAFGALALAMFEASQRAIPFRVIEGGAR